MIQYLGERAKASGRTLDDIPISISAAMRGREGHALGTDPQEILQKARSYEELGVQCMVISSNTRDPTKCCPTWRCWPVRCCPNYESPLRM